MTEMAAYVSEHATHFWQCATPLTNLAAELRSNPGDLGFPVASTMLYGRHLSAAHDNRYYALGHAVRERVTAGVDDTFADVDVLAGPTTLMCRRRGATATSTVSSTPCGTLRPYLTGHPAVSVPCGTSAGLPVGLQFVAPAFEDELALRAAAHWGSLDAAVNDQIYRT